MSELTRKIWTILVTDVVAFNNDMGASVHWGTKIWAALFPLPQFVFGFLSLILVGPTSMGALYLYCRIFSFIVAGQIHKREPFSKKIGPLIHIPFLLLLPVSYHWIFHQHMGDDTSLILRVHYDFIVYTTIITTISWVLDAMTTIKILFGQEVGKYRLNQREDYTLVV